MSTDVENRSRDVGSRSARALLLLHSLSLGGAPKLALDAFTAIKGQVSVHTVAPQRGIFDEAFRRLGPVQLLSDLPLTARYIRRFQRTRHINRWHAHLQRWDPDVIYINSVAALSVVQTLPLPPAPILLHVHESEFGLERFGKKHRDLIVSLPDRYIAVSEFSKRSLMKAFSIGEDKIEVIHAFVPDQLQDYPASPSAGDGSVFVVGGAGNATWFKGVTLWLLMASELLHILGKNNVRFVWVGGGDENDSFTREFHWMIRKLGLTPYVEIVPSTTEPLKHFAQFDVFAITSWEDSCPLVVLENMMLRKPVVCFAESGGAVEEIGETGVAIEGFSPQSMAESIADLARSPGRRAILGEAARERVLRNFTASVQAPKILREISRLAPEFRGGHCT